MSGAAPSRPAGAPAPGAREASARRSEVATGLVSLAAIAALLVWALGGFGGGGGTGHELRASFARIDGLGIGADVEIAGVTVGRVTAETIDPATFQATVRFRLRSDLRLPVDSSASILSDGLLGGKYLSISPGGDERTLAPGGLITATQGSIGLEALLGRFIGSVTGLMDAVKAAGLADRKPAPGSSAPGSPAPAADGLGP